MGMTKRSFSSVSALKRLKPTVLADMLRLFPGFLEETSVTLPDEVTGDSMNYPSILRALMGERVPDELDEILYLASHLGRSDRWPIVEQQARQERRELPPVDAGFSYVDQAILAETASWPVHSGFLRRANLRVRVHSRSSYVYFPMQVDYRHRYREVTPEGLETVRRNLVHYYMQEGLIQNERHGRGLEIIPYDFAEEIWFLVRYPGKIERLASCGAEGEWDDLTCNPEQYDAIAYSKAHGDIRMNTVRTKDMTKYRIEFGHLLFDEANVFDHRRQVVSLDPLAQVFAEHLFGCDDIPELEMIHPISIRYEMPGSPTRKHTEQVPSDGSLLSGNPWSPRLVPDHALTVTKAEFVFKLAGSTKTSKLTLYLGNRICYDRDGDSVVLENWLRRRGFVRSFIEQQDHGPEAEEAA